MVKVVTWLSTCILVSLPNLVKGLNWEELRQKVNSADGERVAKIIADNWLTRPVGFFQGVERESWRRILPLLSDYKVWTISEAELKENFGAFQALSEHLSHLADASSAPLNFRSIFYDMIVNSSKDSLPLMKFLPVSWILLDGPTLANILVSMRPPKLWLLSNDGLEALLTNTKGSCKHLTFNAIRYLDKGQLNFITPSCMAAIKGLDQMDLSTLVLYLKPNVFELYNGPLSPNTIGRLSGAQVTAYGSKIGHETIACEFLELRHLNFSVASRITSGCLYGYFSRPKSYGLEFLWAGIPTVTLKEFTPWMKRSWENVYSADFAVMPSSSRVIILEEPYACAKFDQSILNSNIIRDMSGLCLYTMISQSTSTVRLRELWRYVSSTAQSVFTLDMRMGLENLDRSDLPYMPPSIAQIYLTLPRKVNLSNLFEWPQASPNHELGQFIEDQQRVRDNNCLLPLLMPPDEVDNVVELFNTVDLLDSFPSQSNSRSSSLSRAMIPQREASAGQFSLAYSRVDFCNQFRSILNNPEVLSISKKLLDLSLERSVGLSLQITNNDLRIRSSLQDVSKLLREWKSGQKIEVWNQMLETLDVHYWTGIFRHKDLTITIGEICDFWNVIFSNRRDILGAIGGEALSAICPECVLELDNMLKLMPEIVPLLSNDAFSRHKVGQLPCKLAALSPAQIGQLSKDNIVDPQNPTLKEISEHALSKISLSELKFLNRQQFTVLYLLQWVFIPKDIQSEALAWHFNLALGRLDEFSSNFTKEQGTLYNGEAETIVEALNLYVEICQSGEKAVEDSVDLVKVLSAITNDSKLQEQFVLEFLKYPRLRPLVIALAKNSDEFGSYLEQVSQVESSKGGRLEIELDRRVGFDRVKLLEILSEFPKVFAGRGAFVKCQGLSDQGGPISSLVDQLLTDIERDLIRPGPKISINSPDPSGQNKSNVEELKGATDSSPSTTTISGSNCKFAWGISRKAGLVAGLSFGKAVQLGMSLPFEIDSTFYLLLFDKSEATLRNYYEAAYKSDIEGFKQRAFMLYNQDPSGQSLEDVLTRIDRLRFIQLSARADPKEAESDITARGNIMASQEGEEYQLDPDLTPDESLNLYLQSHDDRIFEEFKAFVSEFILGASYCFPSIGHFATIPSTLYGKLSALMASYFNSKPINGDQIVSRIRFFGDGLVQCLIPGRFVNASVVLSAFVQSLERNQLERLIAIWTGASALSLKKTSLKVKFTGPSVDSQASFDFCGVGGTAMPGSHFFVNPGKQYKQLFSKVVGRLFAPSVKVEADCPLNGGLFAIIRVSSCRRVLEIPKLSAQELINGLVDLINTPVTFIRDG